MEQLLRRLTTHGLRQGFGGSRAWMVAGLLAVGIRALRRMATHDAEILYRTEVKAGDLFEIVSSSPRSRRSRR